MQMIRVLTIAALTALSFNAQSADKDSFWYWGIGYNGQSLDSGDYGSFGVSLAEVKFGLAQKSGFAYEGYLLTGVSDDKRQGQNGDEYTANAGFGWGARAIYKKPINNQFALFGSGGISQVNYEFDIDKPLFSGNDSESYFGANLGVGISLIVATDVEVKAGYEAFMLSGDDKLTGFNVSINSYF